MWKLAERVKTLRASSILEISARAQTLKERGIEVISLAAGEPDFNTPESIQNAATYAMARGITRYTPSAGFLALREVIAEMVSRENQFPVTPNEIIITCGAKHAIFLALQCLTGPGDTVVLPTPAWVSYSPMIELSGATILPLPLFEEDDFQVNVERWKGMAIPSNVRGIILNSPNNPTGVVYTRSNLIRIVGWALQRNLWILSDEIYEKIIYDGEKHVSVASLGPEVKCHCITISGFSKSFAMTGWRVGWAIAPEELATKMAAFQSQSNSHVTSFAQWGAIEATKLPSHILDTMVGVFEKRRNYCLSRLASLRDHLTFRLPKGAFYFFLNLSRWLTPRKMTDVEFCAELLAKKYVGLVPGSYFGKEKFVRMSYATSEENLKKAFDRMEEFLGEQRTN